MADLDARRHPFHVAIENWQHDLNIGTVVRNANAFLAAEVHIVGNRRWNRRGAMVTDRYQHVRHHPTLDDLAAFAAELDLPVLGVDNLPGSVPIDAYRAARALRAAVRPGGARASPTRPARWRARCSHPPVRLHALDQRGGGRGDRDARVGTPLQGLIRTTDCGAGSAAPWPPAFVPSTWQATISPTSDRRGT